MRTTGFAGVRLGWGPFPRLGDDVVRSAQAVRWSGGVRSFEAIDDGMGGFITNAHPASKGQITLEIVRESRSHLALIQTLVYGSVISNLPAPMFMRDLGTSELWTFSAAQLRGMPPQHKGSSTGTIAFTWDFKLALPFVRDINTNEIGT